MSQEKLIRIPQVMDITGLAKSTIWMKIQNQEFPKQIKISPRISVWRLSQVEAWIEEQINKDVA